MQHHVVVEMVLSADAACADSRTSDSSSPICFVTGVLALAVSCSAICQQIHPVEADHHQNIRSSDTISRLKLCDVVLQLLNLLRGQLHKKVAR